MSQDSLATTFIIIIIIIIIIVLITILLWLLATVATIIIIILSIYLWNLYSTPSHGNYSEALSPQAQAKRKVLSRL